MLKVEHGPTGHPLGCGRSKLPDGRIVVNLYTLLESGTEPDTLIGREVFVSDFQVGVHPDPIQVAWTSRAVAELEGQLWDDAVQLGSADEPAYFSGQICSFSNPTISRPVPRCPEVDVKGYGAKLACWLWVLCTEPLVMEVNCDA